MMQLDSLKLLRVPFEAHQISKLPKPYSKDSAKGNCKECGGYHGLPAVHLDYVGHAALTDRLLEVDPLWNWKPVAMVDGVPVIDKDGGMWIELTVCGMTRLGYGDAQGKTGGNATKERIGDALRNAAMRFGAALDLWHKGDLHDAQNEQGTAKHNGKPTSNPDFLPNDEELVFLNDTVNNVKGCAKPSEALQFLKDLEADEYAWVFDKLDSKVRGAIKKYQESLKQKDEI